MNMMGQKAPFPAELADIVAHMSYRPGWRFGLHDGWRDAEQTEGGLYLSVVSLGYNTHHIDQGETYRVEHHFIVPAATYNRQSWLRWVLDRLIDIETHEACEFFRVPEPTEDGSGLIERQPFAPNHGPGWDPYQIRELNTAEAAETDFRGKRHEGTHS